MRHFFAFAGLFLTFVSLLASAQPVARTRAARFDLGANLSAPNSRCRHAKAIYLFLGKLQIPSA